MAWVAAQFSPSLRSDKLTWSHHVLLAPLDGKQQAYWLDRASGERLSVADLRVELRAVRKSAEKREVGSGSDVESAAHASVCPHCGHELAKPAG
jgi:hypothetical protein